MAAEYISREFKAYGLEPINKSYVQPFTFVSGVRLGKSNSFSATLHRQKRSFALDADFRPLGFSSSGTYTGEIVFAGYGITAPERQYDDYAGIDVKDKAVLLLRYHPEGDNQHSEFGRYASLRHKASKAREMGARVMLLVTGPADSAIDELIKLSYDQSMGNTGIIAVNISRETADSLLSRAGLTLKELQANINASKMPKSFPIKDVTIEVKTDVQEIQETTENVVGLLEGSDPTLKKETIIIGAHYDHLGLGGEGSGSLRPDTVAIHNGADDNGSGTAGLLELAQYFVANRSELKRTILFIAFSGEELGLLGSAYYVKNPLLPLENTVAMLNMDMIGRLNDRKLIVYGVGTSPRFEELANRHNKDSMFVLKLVKDGFGPSDHSSFYAKNIPVFHFFTDLHGDYHRPSDDYDKINYEGMQSVLSYIASIVLELANMPERPQYVRVETPRPAGDVAGRSSRSYTGTIPDFGEQGEGMRISGVREGSPAAKAGLQGGDIIIKFGKVEIKNLYDYTYALGEYNPGDQVEVIFKRGNETKTVKLTIGKRN
jgi:aminopeptidase YwaD